MCLIFGKFNFSQILLKQLFLLIIVAYFSLYADNQIRAYAIANAFPKCTAFTQSKELQAIITKLQPHLDQFRATVE